MRKLIVLQEGHTRSGSDFVSETLQAVLTSNFVRYIGTT